MKVFVYFIGKPRDRHANAMAAEFIKRSGRYAICEMREIVPERFELFNRHAAGRKVFLDPAGRASRTAEFVTLVSDAEQTGQNLVFLIGGHDGLPPEWKPRADLLLSLSPMTFPHELARDAGRADLPSLHHLARASLSSIDRQRLADEIKSEKSFRDA